MLAISHGRSTLIYKSLCGVSWDLQFNQTAPLHCVYILCCCHYHYECFDSGHFCDTCCFYMCVPVITLHWFIVHFWQTVLNEEPNMKVCTKASACDLEGDSFSLISVTGLSSRSHFTTEQKKPQTQLLPRGYHAQKVDEYCANGFDLVYHESKTSCSSSNKLSFAGAVDSEASLSSAGLVKGNNSSEGQYMSTLKTQLPDSFLVSPKKPSPVSTDLVQDGYTSDSHYQTGSGTPTPLNLQIYSIRTSLVSESINSIPSYHSGATFSKDLKKKISSMRTEWPPLCWVDIPLSSVKLQASEKTGGHLVPSLGDLCKCSLPTMKDYSVQKASLGQSAKACQEYLPVSQEQRDLLEHTDCSNDASSDSSPEANSTTKKASFGYELHPQAWSCTQWWWIWGDGTRV